MPRRSPVRDRLLRAILGGAGQSRRGGDGTPPTLYALAKTTDIAFAWVHETVKELAMLGLLSTDGGVRVVDAPGTFRWWADHRQRPTGPTFYVQDPVVMSEELRSRGIDLAATTYYAEIAYARHLFPRRFDAYIEADQRIPARNHIITLGGQR